MGTQQFLPQARTDQLVVHTLPDETLVYDLTRHTAHCLNHTAALVLERCDGQTSVADLASRLGQQLDAPVHEDVVWLALEELERVHLLQAPAPPPAAGTRMSRRKMVRQLGLGAAIALPAILSLIAPEAAAAASCFPDGRFCFPPLNVSTKCCSQCCTFLQGCRPAHVIVTGQFCLESCQCVSNHCSGFPNFRCLAS